MKKLVAIAIYLNTIFIVMFIWHQHTSNPAIANGVNNLENKTETQLSAKTNLFQNEYARMKALASSSHKKCPINILLPVTINPAARSVLSLNRIPAYPHLSDIYLYIVPPMRRGSLRRIVSYESGQTSDYEYFPLTVKDIEEQQWRLKKEWKYKGGDLKWSGAEILDAGQKDNITPILRKYLEKTIAFCTADKNGVPKKIIVVDTPFHENLEQEDALTIAAGLVLYDEPVGVDQIRYKPTLGIQTSQYIPRWRVYPSSYSIVKNDRKYTYGFAEFTTNPYKFSEVNLINMWREKASSIEHSAMSTHPIFSGDYIQTPLSLEYKLLARHSL